MIGLRKKNASFSIENQILRAEIERSKRAILSAQNQFEQVVRSHSDRLLYL